MKKWSADNPKAPLMERKRAAIVAAAQETFLQSGYSQASMDGIATSAGVSVKTIYSHFKNKKDLFRAVMQAACLAEGAPAGSLGSQTPHTMVWSKRVRSTSVIFYRRSNWLCTVW